MFLCFCACACGYGYGPTLMTRCTCAPTPTAPGVSSGVSSGEVTIRPASIDRGAVVDLGPTAPGFPVGIPMVIAGALLGCAALLLLAARRGTGLPS